jgi:hypothetical protein
MIADRDVAERDELPRAALAHLNAAMSAMERLRTFASSPFDSYRRCDRTAAGPQLADIPIGTVHIVKAG